MALQQAASADPCRSSAGRNQQPKQDTKRLRAGLRRGFLAAASLLCALAISSVWAQQPAAKPKPAKSRQIQPVGVWNNRPAGAPNPGDLLDLKPEDLWPELPPADTEHDKLLDLQPPGVSPQLPFGDPAHPEEFELEPPGEYARLPFEEPEPVEPTIGPRQKLLAQLPLGEPKPVDLLDLQPQELWPEHPFEPAQADGDPLDLQPVSALAQEVPPAPSLGPSIEGMSLGRQVEQLWKRLGEVEKTRVAHEDATRTIIKQGLEEAKGGPKINEWVTFGGTLETIGGWSEDFDGTAQSDFFLDTAELDFEIQVNDWTLGSLVFEYFDGSNFSFPTTEEDEVFVDRVNVRQAWITIGNLEKSWLYGTFGRDVVPFGISTGDPVADVLTIDDPMTVEVFETREDFILVGFQFPVYPPGPKPVPSKFLPPQVRPQLINPLVRRHVDCLAPYLGCYPASKKPTTWTPPAEVCYPIYSGGVYVYNGNSTNGGEDHIENFGATLRYRNKGTLADQCTPWTFDAAVDFNNSVFDSNFLQFEYRKFLDEIGFVPGMAAHVKSSIGPFALIAEWNGALDDADFDDDLGAPVDIAPGAWQVSLNYQFDWNPYVESIGAQGTYLAMGYSQSYDLAGVMRVIDAVPQRVGFVPERRFLIGFGEWVADGLRVAVEYSHNIDYDLDDGGTGESANGVFSQLTYEW